MSDNYSDGGLTPDLTQGQDLNYEGKMGEVLDGLDLSRNPEGFLEQAGNMDLSKLPIGLQTLIKGYIEYSEEVIKNRALPDGRDGLKPVIRRVLETLRVDKKKGLQKCADVAGATLRLHPHGDQAVYQAMARVVDENGSLTLPLLKGQGSFGKAYNKDKPAAPRYTECMLHDNAFDYFGEMNGITFVPNYNASTTEPELLPVNYPALLCNVSSGIAVGFGCRIPSFNYSDVLDLSIEYAKTGKCTTVICPDFITGGYYIKNDRELSKIMQTGRGKIKLRGRAEVVDKTINLVEYPYGNTLQSIKAEANKVREKGGSGISSVSDFDDFEHGALLSVVCTSKRRVDEVLLELYKSTGLQDTFSVNMTAIIDGKPITQGVYGWIKTWVEWRREVLTKEYISVVDDLRRQLPYPLALMEVLKYPEKRDVLVDLIVHKSDREAVQYILDNFSSELIDLELATWIVKRRTSEFRDGGKYKTKFDSLMLSINQYEGYIQDIDSAIVSQLEALKAKKGYMYPRKTEITSQDYDFISDNEVEIAKDLSECYYELKDGFLKKLRYENVHQDGTLYMTALASDTLIGFDNYGRVLRVYCEHLPYCSSNELGIFLPRYFGFEEDDNLKLMWFGVLDGTTQMITYSDGNVGFLDTSEWADLQRQVKVVDKGVSPESGLAIHVGDAPSYLYVCDSAGRLSCTPVAMIKQKSRTARTRVFNCLRDCSVTSVAYLDTSQGLGVVKNVSRYQAPKFNFLESQEDFIGDAGWFKTTIV